MFLYQISVPSHNVKGVSTADDDIQLVTQSEVRAQKLVFVKTNPNSTEPASTSTTPYTVHQIQVFVDNKPKDAKFDEIKEGCLNKSVVIYVDNGHKVRKFGVSGCSQPIRIKTKVREVTVGIESISGYKNTGLTYIDKPHPKATTILEASKVKVKGFYTYGQYYTVIDFGVKK